MILSSASRGVGRYVVVFWELVLAGLVIWALSTPAVAVILFGEAAYEAAYSSPLYGFLGLPLLAVPPLIAGFVLPKGFFMWGVATVLPHLVGAAWTFPWSRAEAEVVFMTPNPGAGQILGLVFVELMIFISLVLVCTVSSGIGAGARYLILWRRGWLGQSPLGAG
jgi:hypothetical protein